MNSEYRTSCLKVSTYVSFLFLVGQYKLPRKPRKCKVLFSFCLTFLLASKIKTDDFQNLKEDIGSVKIFDRYSHKQRMEKIRMIILRVH